jgi:hypothetical protein
MQLAPSLRHHGKVLEIKSMTIFKSEFPDHTLNGKIMPKQAPESLHSVD